MAPVAALLNSSNGASPKAESRALQERLHELISRLADTSDVIKTWPESEADGHMETTTRLIGCIYEVIKAIERVEGVIKANNVLSKALKDCPVPIDLLDLMDYGGGVNPDCFSRELLREALGQLAGLKRRKLALEMLGASIQSGLNKKKGTEDATTVGIKRKREEEKDEGEVNEPLAKKSHT